MSVVSRLLPLLLLCPLAAGCGGGGSADGGGEATPQNAGAAAAATSPAPSTAASGAASLSASDQATAEKLYAGTPRTPVGFTVDAPPTGITGQVTTLHLRNSDAAAVETGAARFELCTDDVAQAIAWSELKAAATSPYADLVESSSDTRSFELVRVPRGDASARVRHRVFRCGYLDRAGSDLGSDTGAAGALRARPADANALKALVEYLWQFTSFNNADYVVTASMPKIVSGNASGAGAIAHEIELARLTRASTPGGCDRIELLRWTHTLDPASGALTRRLDVQGSFGARRDTASGVVQSCTL